MTPWVDVPFEKLELFCVDISPPKRKPFLVVAWYKSPSDPVDSFNKLEKALVFLDQEGKEIILLGDTNCDLAKKSTDHAPDKTRYQLSTIINISTVQCRYTTVDMLMVRTVYLEK